MTNAYYSLYIDKVVKLALTLSIKSVATAEVMNYFLGLQGYAVDENDPRTWKYFLNEAGQYHASDTRMQVVSADTLEVIDFTTENLAVHLATKRNYAYGTRYYKSLVAQYPEQEDLILRIVNPVDIDVAIAAEDGAILWYDTDLVDSNETTLIPALQAYIYRYMERWIIPAYRIIDELDPTVHIANYAAGTIGFILNHRLSTAKTLEAHDFHIRMYLASHAGLDKYMPYMTKRQSLYLYRNIRYLQRHAGKQRTYRNLVEVILEERGFPLLHYLMRHDLSSTLTTMDPLPMLWRMPIDEVSAVSAGDIFTLDKVLTKEDGLARSNETIHEDALATITEKLTNSQRDTLLTKVVESVAVDDTNSQFVSRADSDLCHWLYMAGKGYYRAVITVRHPATGDTINLSPVNAFILYFYGWCRAQGVVPTVIPMFTADQVLRDPLPTFAELRAVTDASVLSDLYIQAALDYGYTMTPVISIEGFYNVLTEIQNRRMVHRDIYAIQDDMDLRREAKKLAGRFYQDIDVFLAPEGTLYTDWFTSVGLNMDGIEMGQWADFYIELFEEATGANLDESYTLAEVQKAMIDIMVRLSSYNIQFLRDINTDDIVTDDWAALRWGRYSGGGSGSMTDAEPMFQVTDVRVSTQARLEVALPAVFPETPVDARGGDAIAVDLFLQPVSVSSGVTETLHMDLGVFYVLEVIE